MPEDDDSRTPADDQGEQSTPATGAGDHDHSTGGGPDQAAGGERAQQAPARPSATNLATDATTKAYVKFFAACFALVGAAAGLAVLFVGFVGGAPLTSGLLDLASTRAPSVGPMMDQLYANRLAFQTLNAAPVVAAVLGVAAGFYTARTLDGSDRHTYVASGLGAGVGALVLVLVVGVLASFAISSVPVPEQAQQASTTSMLGVDSASGALSLVYIGGTQLAFQKLAFNAAAVGLGVGLVSAGSAYVDRELSPTN